MLTEKKMALYPLSPHQRGATETVQFSLVGSEPMRETRHNGTKCF